MKWRQTQNLSGQRHSGQEAGDTAQKDIRAEGTTYAKTCWRKEHCAFQKCLVLLVARRGREAGERTAGGMGRAHAMLGLQRWLRR